MRVFSRISFICNIGFLLFILLRFVELGRKGARPGEGIIPLPFVTGSFVVLGQLAIFVNFFFCLLVLILRASKKTLSPPQWVIVVNFIFLLFQVYYFFI
jgi:hypothetical protein